MMSEQKHIQNSPIIAHTGKGLSTLGLCIAVAVCLLTLMFAAPAFAADSKVAANTAGMPPSVDPVKVLSEPYDRRGGYRNFGEFVNSLFNYGARVLVYGDENLQWRPVTYTYPKFYTPTWREMLDLVAWQTGSTWAFDEQRRQYKFSTPAGDPPYSFKLSDGWTSMHREMYTAYMPKELPTGMDVYYFGHFTTPPGRDPKRYVLGVRDYFAQRILKEYHVKPIPSVESDMRRVNVANSDAVYWEPPQSHMAFKADSAWRQWSFVANGQAFVIISATGSANKSKIAAEVDKMLQTFTVKSE